MYGRTLSSFVSKFTQQNVANGHLYLKKPSTTTTLQCSKPLKVQNVNSPSVRNFSSAVMIEHSDWHEETPTDVFLERILDDQMELRFRTRHLLKSAGISKVGQLKSQGEKELEKMGVLPDVIKKIQKAFDSLSKAIPITITRNLISTSPSPSTTPTSTINPSEIKINIEERTTPSMKQSYWTHTGNTRPLLMKSSEDFWKDTQDNRQELSWYLNETFAAGHASQSNGNMQWFKDWKLETPTSKQTSSVRPQFQLNTEAPSTSTYAVADLQITNSAQSPNSNKTVQRFYFDALAQNLNIRTFDDWYFVNVLDVVHKECKDIIMNHYDNSLCKALVGIYPENEWKMWKFDYGFKGLFNNQPDREDVDQAHENLHGSIKNEDFNTTVNRYRDHWQVRMFTPSKGDSLAHKNVTRTEKNTDPSFDFVTTEQRYLFDLVKQMFPNKEVKMSYSQPELVYSDTSRPFDLCIYLPEDKVAFEYLEDPNYDWQYSFGAQFSFYTFYKAKKSICDKLGITLIEVPSWWDKKATSLSSAIKKYRPDLFERK